MTCESNNAGDLRKHPNEPELRENILESRRQLLLVLCCSEMVVADMEKGRPTLYTKGTIQAKIDGLKKRGFKDPVKMITSVPSVLSYSWENIDGKIKMLNRLIKLYSLNLTAIGLIEKTLNLLGTKIDKLWVLARIIRNTAEYTRQIDSALIHKLSFCNLENIILATRSNTDMTITQVTSVCKLIKKQNMSKSEKREKIAKLPDDDKIKRRYFKGYPMKK